MPIDGGSIASQVGASGGLWTHTPVDWRGNETGTPAPPGGWPANAGVAIPPAGSTAQGAGQAPVITAVSVTAILATSATVNYTVNPAVTSQVEYGTTIAYGTIRPVSPNTGSGAKTVGLTGLTGATVYFYRVFATANNLTSYVTGTFTTA